MSDHDRVPHGWARHRLSDLVDVDPENLTASTPKDYEFRYIDITAVEGGKLSIPTQKTMRRSAPSRAQRVVRRGDVLMSTVRPNLKAFALVQCDYQDLIASTGFAVLRARNGSSPVFVLNSILSDDVSAQINCLVAGSNYPAISSRDVRNLNILAPNCEIQTAIGDIFFNVDQLISHTESLISKYQSIKHGLMHDLFTRGIDENGKLRPRYEDAPQLYKKTELGWVPKEWEVCTLGNIIQTIIDNRGRTPPLAEEGVFELLEIASLRDIERTPRYEEVTKFCSKDVSANWFRDHILPGDILVSTVGSVGLTALVEESRGGIAQNLLGLRVKAGNSPDFVFYWMNSFAYWRQVRRVVMDAVQPSLKRPHLLKIWICLPSSNEQIEIGSRFRATSHVVEQSRAALAKLHGLKQGLMHDLLTGKVPVKLKSAHQKAA